MNIDDRLRDAMKKAVPPVETPEGLADALIARAATGAAGAASSFGSLWMWAAIALVTGAVIGGALGYFGGGDPAGASVLPLDGVPVYACPGAGEVGTLHRGDRVLITGRSEDGAWLTVRNVRGALDTVYVRAEHVLEDGDVAVLPLRDCEDQGILTVGPESTTTTLVEATTTTVIPDTTTTQVEETTTTAVQATTTTMAETTTTELPDVTAPEISNEAVVPGVIWEQNGLGVSCPPGTPRQSVISAFVTDDTGVTKVTAAWTDPFGSQSVTMTGAGAIYSAVFGPYAAGDWDPLSVAPFEHEVTVTISASDAAGNGASVAIQVTLIEIGECFG